MIHKAMAERPAESGSQGKFSGRREIVQAELSCPYRLRPDEPHDRKGAKAL